MKIHPFTLFLASIVFVLSCFKLAGYLAWPWVWVLAPLWVPFALALLLTGALFLSAVIKKRK